MPEIQDSVFVNFRLACSVLQYDIAKYDYERAIRSIADIGYEGIELHAVTSADEALRDKSNLRRLLQSLSLKTASVTGQMWDWAEAKGSEKLAGTLDSFKDSVLLAEFLETERVVTETGRVPDGMDSGAALNSAAENMASACDFASTHGITRVLLENVPPPFNYVVDSSTKFLKFRELCGASNLFANIDASNYLMAGEDLPAALKSLGNLVKGIHIKDGTRIGGHWTPIGEGEVNWSEFFRSLRIIGYDDWLVVEYEGALTGRYYSDPEKASRDSLHFLNKMLGEN
jgi:inosose dehydratase